MTLRPGYKPTAKFHMHPEGQTTATRFHVHPEGQTTATRFHMHPEGQTTKLLLDFMCNLKITHKDC